MYKTPHTERGCGEPIRFAGCQDVEQLRQHYEGIQRLEQVFLADSPLGDGTHSVTSELLVGDALLPLEPKVTRDILESHVQPHADAPASH